MQIGPGIWRAESAGEVVYALDCGGAYGLVDVGSAPTLPGKLEQLRADGVDPEKIVAVFVTHNHPDHVGALPRVRAELSPRVVVHRLAVERLSYCPVTVPIDRELVDYTVDDGDTVEVGETRAQVYHLPGHTPDSVAWEFPQGLFVGDIIFCDGGIGWMDLHWGSCVADYRSSLHRLPRLKPKAIYPGHRTSGPMTRETVDEALRRLSVLAEADGSPIGSASRPAPRRRSDEPAKLIRLPLSGRRRQ